MIVPVALPPLSTRKSWNAPVISSSGAMVRPGSGVIVALNAALFCGRRSRREPVSAFCASVKV